MKKKLLITFDYELFLGSRSGQVIECLIEPTQKILKVLDKHKIKGIFFVDTTYLIRLKQNTAGHESSKKDIDLVADQVRHLVRTGHYVFPHIHPHWIDAVYLPEKNEWQLNNTGKYRFHSIDEKEREQVFAGSYHLLKEIILSVDQHYEIDTYRAGGWCIQPFSDFKPWFEKFGFKIDSSVLAGCYYFSSAQQFDFSSTPSKPIYRFSSDVTEEDINGSFYQFTNSIIAINAFVRLTDKFFLKLHHKIQKDQSYLRGSGQSPNLFPDKKPVSDKGKFFDNEHTEYISVERLTIMKLNSYLQFMADRDYMHFVSHPKMIIAHNLKMLDRFLNKVLSKHEIETDFRKMI